MYLGLDTSNYTTSAAALGGNTAEHVSRLLDVRPGELGLRQSDALFQHVKRLPLILDELFFKTGREPIRAVAASTRPRAVEGSYMPCFLAGETVGRSIAASLGVPFHAVSHQQGHIAAAVWSAGRADLLDKPHLAWHLSGGTTELLLVRPDGKTVQAERIGGTSDVSAGQIMDRTGNLLGLDFPSGKELDRLAGEDPDGKLFPVKLRDLTFSFSGLENQIRQFRDAGGSAEETAAFAVRSVADAVARATEAALKIYPGFDVVFSGGVSSNRMLRRRCETCPAVFCPPCYATDNAVGVAILCGRLEG